jgi:hypothetical protein
MHLIRDRCPTYVTAEGGAIDAGEDFRALIAIGRQGVGRL